jgi:hypothetical protein
MTNPDPGGPKTCESGSGSTTLEYKLSLSICSCNNLFRLQEISSESCQKAGGGWLDPTQHISDQTGEQLHYW